MTRRRVRAVLLLLSCGLAGIDTSAQQPAANAMTTRAGDIMWTRITYISGITIYLEVGARAGLVEGHPMEVVRGGAVIATLRTTAVSSNRAAAEVATKALEPVVGDSVRFTVVLPKATQAAAATSSAHAATARSLGIRGRVGLRYLVISADAGGPGGLQQPAYDLRLDGQHIGGGSVGIVADVRAQRTQYTASSSGVSRSPMNLTRVYQAAVMWTGAASGARVTVGRQFAGAMATVGLYDGIGLDVDRTHWSTGAFAGSQPDAASFGTSSKVREYGLYGSWHARQGGANAASLTFGGVGSYCESEIDREYVFGRLTANTAWLNVYATQEVDFNRGWKREAEHTNTTPTATFASVQLTPVRAVSLFGGLDNRRSVRLWRDYISPEVTFDDSFRQGTWAGASFNLSTHARLSFDRRESRGGTSGDAASTTAMASVSGLTAARVGVRARSTRYDGTISSGQLLSGAVDIDPWGLVRLEASAGARETRTSLAGNTSTRLTWWGLDADVSVGRSVYVMLSAYRERENAAPGTLQTYASLSWRF